MSQLFRSVTGSSSPLNTLTGNSGGAVSPTANNINIVGSGSVVVTGNPGTSTLTITNIGGGISWSEVTGTTQAMTVNSGYVVNNAALVTLTLPVTAALGSVLIVVGKSANGWSIAQNAGQTIHFGNTDTTLGVGGSLSSTARYDNVELICITANTDWSTRAPMGNLTVV